MSYGDYDYEDRARELWQQVLPRLSGPIPWVIVAIIIIVYLISGTYTVGPSEVGLVKRFGRHIGTTEPGMHYHLPWPVESVVTVDMLSVRKVEIGFRTLRPPPQPVYRNVEEEALMLTGDGNITHAEVVVQYRVKGPEEFAFNLIDPGVIIKQAAEAVLRDRLAVSTIDEALTTARDQIAGDAQDLLQDVLDGYDSGIMVVNVQLQDVKPPKPVIAAFDDVNSARQDQQRFINTAEKYEMDILPRARGEAQEITNQAEAYKQRRIKQAEGDVARFSEVLGRYQLGKEVTRTRLYIETMEQILPGMQKIILTEGASGVIKLLDLEKLLKGGGEK